MTIQSDHPPVVKQIQLRIPDGSHPIEVRRCNPHDEPTALRDSDGWIITSHMGDMPGMYAFKLKREHAGENVLVEVYIPLYGGRGSIHFWWEEERLDVQVKMYGEWATIEDNNMWEIAFGSANV